MSRKITQKPKKVQDSASIKELFVSRKKALLSQHKVRKTSKSKRSKKLSASWLDSMLDRIYNGLSQMSVFISWSVSWLLCFVLWAVLLYLVWQEFLMSYIVVVSENLLALLPQFLRDFFTFLLPLP